AFSASVNAVVASFTFLSKSATFASNCSFVRAGVFDGSFVNFLSSSFALANSCSRFCFCVCFSWTTFSNSLTFATSFLPAFSVLTAFSASVNAVVASFTFLSKSATFASNCSFVRAGVFDGWSPCSFPPFPLLFLSSINNLLFLTVSFKLISLPFNVNLDKL
ncbi:hypothetical protein, partial [Ureaplasma urealyticum]|uniref:hypothetical protein n=1 Tax=Ureaplasma urealyticum TaxID=2130 RepID=UPI00307D06B0